MAVWIRIGEQHVAAEAGVIRRADFARLCSADQVLVQARAEAEQLLAEAHAQAEAVLREARVQAEVLERQARERYEHAQSMGMTEGLREATTTWARQVIDGAEQRRRHMNREGERLSQVVSMAVQRIIGQDDPVKLFSHSLETVLKLLRDVPLLTMNVHPDEQGSARAAVASLQASVPEGLRIDVEADPGLQRGGCRFESEDGVIETGLQTQLDALREALQRTVSAVATRDGEGDAEAGRLRAFQCIEGLEGLDGIEGAGAYVHGVEADPMVVTNANGVDFEPGEGLDGPRSRAVPKELEGEESVDTLATPARPEPLMR